MSDILRATCSRLKLISVTTMAAGFCLLPASVRAFEGWEHEAVGSMSLIVGSNHVARLYDGQPGVAERLQKLRETAQEYGRGLRAGTNQTDVTFGTIVKLVDYMRSPYNMTHQSFTGSGWPTNTAGCNLTFLKRVASDKVSLLSASHANQEHFQGRAMFAFWFWHEEAVRLARDGNLWGGLMLEAYANHFLEDLFAPGHILAPRDENAHDVYTLTLHDYYNKRGLNYVISAPKQLAAIAESTEALVRAGTVTIPAGPTAKETERLHLSQENYQEFKHSLENASAQIECHGDNLLRQNPAQLPLVVTYCARAISDVMESYLMAEEINSFKHYRWNAKVFPMVFGKPEIEAIDLQLGFGELSCLDNPRTIGQEGRRDWKPLAGNENGQEQDRFPVTENVHVDAYHNPIVGANFGVQTITLAPETRVRALFEAETMVLGKRFDILRSDWQVPEWLPDQVAGTLGYTGVAGAGEHAHGIFTRVIIPFPRLDLHVSLMAGMRYHMRQDYGGVGDFEKIRVEWGLHMVSLFVGVGHERFADSSGGLAHGLGFEMGLSIGGPVSSFRRLVPSFQ